MLLYLLILALTVVSLRNLKVKPDRTDLTSREISIICNQTFLESEFVQTSFVNAEFKKSMKYVLTFVFYLICTSSLNAQVKIIDSSSGDPVAFATIISKDSIFQTNTNAKGEFKFPSNIDTIFISCIGYETKKVNVLENNSTIPLKYKSYSITEIDITSQRIDIYSEINSVRTRFEKSKKRLNRQSKTTFETINKRKLIERGEIHSNDLITSKDGYLYDKRLRTTYHFDTSSIFIHVDIDKLIRQISLTSKKGFRHLFNRGKIKPSNTKLNIVEEDEKNFLVKYYFGDQYGFLKFNKKSYEISEYNFKSYHIDKDLYKSINNNIGLGIDTLVIDYKFKDDIIEDISFLLSYSVEHLGAVTTSGYIRRFKSEIDWLSTSNNIHSLQYHAYLTSFMEQECGYDNKSIFFNLEDYTVELLKDDELAYDILIHLGHAPKTKFWSDSMRLMPSDFEIFDQNTELAHDKKFRSDYHNFSVDWVFYKNLDIANKYIPLPSIWNSTKAVFISKKKYNTLLLANLTFDIYEIHKSKLVEELKSKSIDNEEEQILNRYYNEAEQMVKEMNKVSSYGNSISKLVKYNDYVFSEKGVNNIEELIEYAFDSNDNSIYSQGDIFLAKGDFNRAIEFYQNVLNENEIELDIQKKIYENLIQVYIKLGNNFDACNLYKEWMRKPKGSELNLENFTLNCD